MVAPSKAIHPLAAFLVLLRYSILRCDLFRMMLQAILAAPLSYFVSVLQSFQDRVDIGVIANLRL